MIRRMLVSSKKEAIFATFTFPFRNFLFSKVFVPPVEYNSTILLFINRYINQCVTGAFLRCKGNLFIVPDISLP